jgi:hypothetical protein
MKHKQWRGDRFQVGIAGSNRSPGTTQVCWSTPSSRPVLARSLSVIAVRALATNGQRPPGLGLAEALTPSLLRVGP